MFGKKKTPVAAPAEGGAEARAQARRKKAARLPKGVKQLIGYDAMLRNGTASLGDGRWSATILFQDINYQLSPESHQMEIIDRWAKLINSFEAGQSVQIASYTRSLMAFPDSENGEWQAYLVVEIACCLVDAVFLLKD